MRILSYNIWFDRHHQISRLDSLISSIISVDADVICFQEVLSPIYHILVNTLKKTYPFYTIKPVHCYGVMIMSKIKIKNAIIHQFSNTNMDRYLLLAELDSPNVIVATSHFESEFKVSTCKYSQYRECKVLLEDIHEKKKVPVILTGDFNCGFNDGLQFYKNFQKWNDCWKDKGTKMNKFTYDGETNPYIKHNYRNRLDRIIHYGKLKTKSFDMHKNVEGLYVPSDHYGVHADIDI